VSIKNFHIPIIAISIIIALLSNFGSFLSVIEPFTFLKMDFNSLERGYLNFFTIESTYNINNEWWRLITPMLIHFSVAHLVFNCLWIYVLGSKIELLDGKKCERCWKIFKAKENELICNRCDEVIKVSK